MQKRKLHIILARGTLDKTLIVSADDFSIGAEKIIIVTGGNVLVLKSK